jgi:hypothetical protein
METGDKGIQWMTDSLSGKNPEASGYQRHNEMAGDFNESQYNNYDQHNFAEPTAHGQPQFNSNPQLSIMQPSTFTTSASSTTSPAASTATKRKTETVSQSTPNSNPPNADGWGAVKDEEWNDF